MIGQKILHYKILEKIGEGGMGVVYKAEDTKLKREVALKFLPTSALQGSDEKDRFTREAQTAAALNHANIAHIYAIEEFDGQMFIAMEFIQGQSLHEIVGANGGSPMPLDKAVNYATQIATGLQAAHEKGVVHRDIKSANIMVTDKGVVKIMDFGLAKLAGRSKLTKSEMTLGTAAYMSPEQAQGIKVDRRSDIFSLGVILYEMLTCQNPFKGDYELAVVYSILNEEPEPITAIRTGVPMELERIVNKTMAKNRNERYQRMDEVLVDLRSLRKKIEFGSLKQRLTEARLPRRKQTYLYAGVVSLLILFIVFGLYFFNGHGKIIDSVAILPFDNANANPDTEYLSDGITESLINSLSQLPNLKVISRTSVFHYKKKEIDPKTVGHDLNVRAVLTGWVVQRGDNLSISAELTDTKDNSHIWGEQYNRKLADILAVQQEISREISEKLRLKLSGEDKKRLIKGYTENIEAYHLYLKGLYNMRRFTKEGLKKGIEYFNQAIAIDPNYALAYNGLAYYYIVALEWLLSPSEAMPKARETARKALEIDDTLAEAHASLGVVNLWYDWDWVAAEREFKRAVELNPNYATAHEFYSWYLVAMGRFDEAIVEIKRAQELDPLSLEINSFLGWSLYFARRYDQAIEQLRMSLDMDPNYWFAHLYLGWAYEQKGELAKAIVELQKARQIEDAIPEIFGALGRAYAVSGMRGKAEKALDELKARATRSYVPPYRIATIYIGLGEKDQAFEWLERAYEERSGSLVFLKVDPMFDNLRSDSRFTALLKKVGLEK